MTKDYDDGYKDFEMCIKVLDGLFKKALEDGVEIPAIMAATSISLVRLASMIGIDKQQLKERLIRDIELIYLSEDDVQKRTMQ
jgi:hypothetical protein